jgi:cell division protein FtsB
MNTNKYFKPKKTAASMLIQGFLVLLFVFAVVFFLWSMMRYNEKMSLTEEKKEKIAQLNDEIEEMRYLVDAPLDEDYKMRIAREKLGMCFPDEIIFHTEAK